MDGELGENVRRSGSTNRIIVDKNGLATSTGRS